MRKKTTCIVRCPNVHGESEKYKTYSSTDVEKKLTKDLLITAMFV